MSKIKKLTRVAEISRYEFDGKLSEIKSRIETLIQEYGSDATIQCEYVHIDCPLYTLNKTRDETDLEYSIRIAKEHEHQEAVRNAELEQLKKLKEKYESGN